MDSDFSVLAMKIRILTAPNERYCEVFTWQEKNKTKQSPDEVPSHIHELGFISSVNILVRIHSIVHTLEKTVLFFIYINLKL